MDFGQRLRELRKSRDLSQGDLANLLGVTRQAVSQYELGVREPNYEILQKIADCFRVDMDYLLGRVNDQSTIAVPINGQPDVYYLDEEAREIVELMHKDPQYRTLFSASRKLSKEDLQIIMSMIERMS